MLRSAWLRLQRSRRRVRWAVKAVFVAAVTFVTLYPHPGVFVRHIRHSRNVETLIDPDAQALGPWRQELEALLPADVDPVDRLRIVENFVYEKVPYAFDWDVWGVVDYLPALDEIVAQGREDCDGRALVAASLMRRYDPETSLASDATHLWIKTSAGEAMSPGGPKVIEQTPRGVETHLRNLLQIRIPATGIALFPFGRQLLIAAAFWLALCDPRIRPRVAAVSALLVLNGLLTVKLAANNVWAMVMWGVWLGFAQMLIGVILVITASRRVMRPSAAR